jgi:hypothetical protein
LPYIIVNSIKELNSRLSATESATAASQTRLTVVETRLAQLQVSSSPEFANIKIAGEVKAGTLKVSGLSDVTEIALERITTKGLVPTVVSALVAAQAAANPASTLAAPALTATVEGNDTSGTLTIVTSATLTPATDDLTVTFNKPYSSTPRALVTASSDDASTVRQYTQTTNNNLVLKLKDNLSPGKTYKFTYWVVQ